MAEPNLPNEDFFNQFIDDYFAECEEHLTLVRRTLLSLEQFVDEPQLDKAQLDELFRAFHTIKGISGMVGLTPAEQLAHEMESYLRVLRHGKVVLTKEGFEALLNGTRTLEEVIASHRAHDALPDITTAVQAIAEAINATTHEPQPEARPSERSGNEKRKWRFLFEPTQDRSQAGINVNSIRSRLQSIGEILQATPIVEKGEVVFEFVVSTVLTESEFTELDELGLTIFPIEEERAAPSQQQAPVSSSTAQTSATSVRVDLVRLDQLMLLVGELVVTRARLEQNLNSIRTTIPSSNWRQLQEVHTAFGKQLRDLRKDVMRVRMVPIAEVFERMRFVVRDVAREMQKRVTVELTGQETEIDKFLVERLADPLLHLVRNAISHGIESESERLAAGKTPQGHIWLSAKTAGEIVIIEIADDGRGLDLDNIQAKAPEVELQDDNGGIDFNRVLNVIAAPGFSTRDEADRASGRGVGMDIVARGIRELDGQLTLHTEPGIGTTFRLELPLTLAITDALVSVVDGQTFAIHRSSVHEVIEINPQTISVLENNEVIVHRDEALPLVRLSRVFNLSDKREGMLHAFVIGTGSRATALVVDKIVGLREVVVRSLNDPLTNVRGVGGATELGDGRPILILDVPGILDATRQTSLSQNG